MHEIVKKIKRNKADDNLSLPCPWAETQFIWFVLGDVAQFSTDVLCILLLGLKELSRYDWENYYFNIPFPPLSLMHIFHYTSLWLLAVQYKWIPQIFSSSSSLCEWVIWVGLLFVCVCVYLIFARKKKAEHQITGRKRTEKDKRLLSRSQELG